MMRRADSCRIGGEAVERTVLVRWLETLACLVLIMLAMVIAVSAYRGQIRRAEVVATTGPLQEARVDVLYYWNLHGRWPQETSAALAAIDFPVIAADAARFATTIEDGVVQLHGVSGALAGETVSVHPVTPAGDPLGPVHWRFGAGGRGNGGLVHGRDRTTLPETSIPPEYR